MDNYNLRINQIINKHGDLILRNPNIVGVGRGIKNINSYNTNKPALVFFVKKKLSVSDLRKSHIIPQFLEGVITDVVESGEFRLRNSYEPMVSMLGEEIQKDDRPALGGGCLYLFREASPGILKPISTATLTYAVTEADSPENIYLLTSGSFLIPKGEFYLGEKVYYSRQLKAATEKNTWIIGTSEKIFRSGTFLKDKAEMNINAGLVKVGNYNDSRIREYLLPKLKNGLGVASTETIIKSKAEISCYKCGASTGCTEGNVKSSGTAIEVENHPKGSGKYVFLNQLIIENKSLAGDGGALSVNRGTDRGVGMLNGGSDTSGFSFYSNINEVLTSLNVKFLKAGY